jgi:hypothetical protein
VRGGLVSRTKIFKICMYLYRVVNSLIIGMQGRYNKTARILKIELRVSVKKTEIQDYLHWIVHMIEISEFS